MTEKNKNYLLLHFVILLGSFVPTMVSWIEVLGAIKLVFVRAVIALVILGGIILFKKHRIKLPKKQVLVLTLSGCLLAAFWVLLVASTNNANASVTLVGTATIPIWVAFILPFFNGGRPDFYQLMTGLNAVFGIYMIFSNDFNYETGLMISISAAFVGALLTVVNSKFVKSHHHTVVTFYQMIGAVLILFIAMPINTLLTDETLGFSNVPYTDFLVAAAMAYLFSVLAYSLSIYVMKRISAFTVSLSNNLAPIYGILIALVLSSKDELMNIYFYSGAIIIVSSVVAFPIVQLFFRELPTKDGLSSKEREKEKLRREMEELRKTIEEEEREKERQRNQSE